LSPKIIKKIKQNYNYKEFKEINEFSQALNAERAIAGVGSDFQAAQLIIDNKIKKLDFTQIYGNGAND
jgi:spermidine/putrescine ABC transporter substrate binding protein